MKFNFKIQCCKDNLSKVRAFVSDSLAKLAVVEEDIYFMTLAIDEVCANLIIHSNKCNDNQSLLIDLDYDDAEGLVVRIADQGEAFDQSNYKEKSLLELRKERRKGGLGIMLVKKIVDKIEYSVDDPYNICTLHKKVQRSA